MDPHSPHGSPNLEDDAPDAPEEGTDGPLPALPVRLLWAFVSPVRLVEMLAGRPRWVGALLVSALVVGISMAVVPVEILLESQRQAALERGADFPEMPAQAVQVMRFAIPIFALLSTVVFTFVFAGLYTVVFAFVLGDEGGYKQYLAVLAHSSFIAAAFALLLVPLRISTENPQLTVNLGSLVFFLGDGYLLNVFRALDISQIWSTLVFARGVQAIDPRRSFGSASAIALTVLVLFALAIAPLM